MERLTENVSGCNQIIKCGNDLCKETCEEWSCDFCPISEAIDKLADYEDAEEQGLLLRLPCKVGSEIYDIKCGHVRESIVSRYDVAEVIPNRTTVKAHIHARINGFHKSFLIDDIGKTVFLTKEEAEQALAEMKGL